MDNNVLTDCDINYCKSYKQYEIDFNQVFFIKFNYTILQSYRINNSE